MKSIEQILAHFGYSDDWLRLGVVTPEILRHQLSVYETSKDQNEEHYRCGAFIDYVSSLDSVSDKLLDDLLELTDAGPDGCDLRINRVFELVLSQLLSNSQLHYINELPGFSDRKGIKTAIARILIKRQLAVEGLTEDIFRDICELNDNQVLHQLLDRSDLARQHVAWVAGNGPNRGLKNRATTMLKSRRFQNENKRR